MRESARIRGLTVRRSLERASNGETVGVGWLRIDWVGAAFAQRLRPGMDALPRAERIRSEHGHDRSGSLDGEGLQLEGEAAGHRPFVAGALGRADFHYVWRRRNRQADRALPAGQGRRQALAAGLRWRTARQTRRQQLRLSDASRG